MQLEKQLEKLAEFGLTLNPGVTVDDLVQGFGRESLEEPPFDSLLLVLGMETQDESLRTICSHAWNFDPECITETGDYSDIVRRLLEVAG